MKQISIVFIAIALSLSACSPKVRTTVTKHYPTLDYREVVKVLGIQDSVPSGAEILGIVKIGDTGFSTNCGWDVVIYNAKLEARKIGGNAIKITHHNPPSIMGSSCHRITAKILKVTHFELQNQTVVIDSALLNVDYALLHVYRHRGASALVNYDLHLGDTVICRVRNNWKETIKIKKDGYNSLWAKTESKAEIPINIKFGSEYYIRCSVGMGVLVGRPKLVLVDNQTGRIEFQSIEADK